MLLFLAYGCTDDDAESHGTGMICNPDKSTFSIGEAKELYDHYIGQNPFLTVSQTKSDGYNISELIPLWNEGLLSSDNRWATAEMPIESNMKQGSFMPQEVFEYVMANKLHPSGFRPEKACNHRGQAY